MIAVGLGALIGLEREFEIQRKKRPDFAGLRTFILISLFGAVTGFLSFGILKSPTLVIVAFISIVVLIFAGYLSLVLIFKQDAIGMTTEVAALITFILGFMCIIGYDLEAIIISIVVVMFLALKEPMHGFVKKIKVSEVYATLKFAVVTLLILPFLPNVNYTPMDVPVLSKIIEVSGMFPVETIRQLNVFNPFKIWLMVVFISGISFVGYVLMRIIGAGKGLGVTGLLGGIASSTALSSSMSMESRKTSKVVLPFVMAVIIACSTMFFRIIVEVTVVNPNLLKLVLIPMVTMGFAGFFASFILWRRIKQQRVEYIELSSPFTLGPALKFAAFFVFVLVISKLGNIIFGAKGVYLAAFLSGLADVDAITLSMATISSAGEISLFVATFAITIAAIVNTFVKAGIAYLFGSESFRKWVLLILGIIVACGLLSIFFLVVF